MTTRGGVLVGCLATCSVAVQIQASCSKSSPTLMSCSGNRCECFDVEVDCVKTAPIKSTHPHTLPRPPAALQCPWVCTGSLQGWSRPAIVCAHARLPAHPYACASVLQATPLSNFLRCVCACVPCLQHRPQQGPAAGTGHPPGRGGAQQAGSSQEAQGATVGFDTHLTLRAFLFFLRSLLLDAPTHDVVGGGCAWP